MTKVEELKKMYENMGGDPEAVADKTLITEMLDAMSELELSGLPDVTADDNGEILTVVDGEWNKAAAPTELPAVTADDNGDVLSVVDGAWVKNALKTGAKIYECTYVSATGYTLSNGVKSSDIYNEILSGNYDIIIRVTRSNQHEMYYRLAYRDKDALTFKFQTITIDLSAGVTYLQALTIDNNDTSTVQLSASTI